MFDLFMAGTCKAVSHLADDALSASGGGRHGGGLLGAPDVLRRGWATWTGVELWALAARVMVREWFAYLSIRGTLEVQYGTQELGRESILSFPNPTLSYGMIVARGSGSERQLFAILHSRTEFRSILLEFLVIIYISASPSHPSAIWGIGRGERKNKYFISSRPVFILNLFTTEPGTNSTLGFRSLVLDFKVYLVNF